MFRILCKYFGYRDIDGCSVTVNDILTGINVYSDDNSFSSRIVLLRYITVHKQMFLDMLQLLEGDIIIFKIYSDKFTEGLLLTLKNLDFSNLIPNILTHPKFCLFLYTFTLYKLIAISVHSSIISSFISYSFSAHQVLARRIYATLTARFSKANLQS